MLDESYLDHGITAMSRAGDRGTMSGHTGAAIIAAYFFVQENELEEGAGGLLQGLVDGIIADGGKEWDFQSTAPEELSSMFTPYPREEPDGALLQQIPSALAEKIGLLRESGHCTTFTALALKALKSRPEMITPSVVEGICRLIGNFGDSPGQGYYGEERGWLKGVPVETGALTPYRDAEEPIAAAFAELIAGDKIRRKGYGGLVHLVTHTNALTELAEMGYGDLAQQGYRAHQTHILLLRGLPPDLGEDGETVQLRAAEHSPRTRAYWRWVGRGEVSASALHRGGTAHAIKVSYAFFHLLGGVRDLETWARYADQLGYIT